MKINIEESENNLILKAVKTNLKNGEFIRRILLDYNLLNKNYKLKKLDNDLYLPLNYEEIEEIGEEDLKNTLKNVIIKSQNQNQNQMDDMDFEIITTNESDFEKSNNKKNPSFKDYLLNNYSDELTNGRIAHAYDIIGDIVILQISDEIDKEERLKLGEKAKELIPSVRAVFRRESDVKGEYRVRDLEHLAGEENTLTLYKENGYKLYVDVAKVYFSPRLSWERNRIMQKVEKDDVIVDMFCGVGPYSIACKDAKKIYSIDVNPEAIKLLKENIKLNNLENKIFSILEDVRKVDLKGNRIIMNLPKYANQFVDKALDLVEEGGTIHYYMVGADVNEGINLFKSKCECEVLESRVVKSYSPREYVFVIDFKINNPNKNKK
ncbi:tRNA (guanine37-N1)-methyltransferase [Methanococcus voltae]|nr:class I SAM-dependent methyltransferase family protein [Methanococcus voltae]MBP2172270.1 tRNA (guanine37-N1)-methyltransferase [Methanococcus voltae]